ncbi:MAG: M28 family peptidase [Acidobacteriota bacterium]|nr:M28 family peptidase [Acidobacteriota bacterium]
MMLRRATVVLAAAVLVPPPIHSQQPPDLRGFTPAGADAERALERRFRAIPSPEKLREYMRAITEEPHYAGGPGSRKVADYMVGKFTAWGLNASIEETEALLPLPLERRLELVAPERFVAALTEPRIEADSDSGDAGQLPTFNAYAADGDVTADLVYVNYGIPEDYEQLRKLNVDVKGKIVLARYGRSWRGIKAKLAWEHGALGCIIYSDPRDDGFFQGASYPEGPWRPEHGVQRGSVMDMPIHPGDPLTPGWGAKAGGRRLSRTESATLLRIPVLPISYADALPLLRNLKGVVAPEAWRGALPVTYHVGPGPSRVHLKVAFDWQIRPVYNVIVRIPGADFPDEWIIYGNHHDAWVNGASDPTSANVALMETARGLAELLRSGWKPRRTIVLASWDGEEWGLMGSTEWAETHQEELRRKAVVYINSDSTGKGWLGMGGSHSLQAFINEVARDVDDPRGTGMSVLDARRARLADQAATTAERDAIRGRREIPLDALGSGSDYTAFLDHLQIASLNLGFGGDDGGGVYHSIYDSFHWYTTFSDGTFVHGAALSQIMGTALLRLANADVLPFDFRAMAETLGKYVDEIDALGQERIRSSGAEGREVDLSRIRTAVRSLSRAADAYERAVLRVPERTRAPAGARLAELNRLLYSTERAFRHEPGLPRRPWFKHLVYAPGFYTGYGVKTLPGIREGIEQDQWDEAKSFVPIVAGAINRLAREVDRAAALLKRTGD